MSAIVYNVLGDTVSSDNDKVMSAIEYYFLPCITSQIIMPMIDNSSSDLMEYKLCNTPRLMWRSEDCIFAMCCYGFCTKPLSVDDCS